MAEVTKMISYLFCLFWFCFPKFLGRRGWNLRTQENSIDKKRIDVNNESMDETVKDTQYGFMGLQEKLETWTWTMAQKRNSSNTLLGELLNTRQAGCINNQTIQMMITMRNPTLSLTLGPCLSPFQMQN